MMRGDGKPGVAGAGCSFPAIEGAARPAFHPLDHGAVGWAYWKAEVTGTPILNVITSPALLALYRSGALDGLLSLESRNFCRDRRHLVRLERLAIVPQGEN